MDKNEEKVLKFIWKVENYSYCWNKDNFLQSPDFQMNVFEGSSWCLKLYPGGVSSYKNYVSVILGRLESSRGPLGITVDYEIALLRPDGTAEYVKETKNRCFRKGHAFGFNNLAAREEVLGTKRSVLLPEDILTVQCRIIPKGVQLKTHTEIIAKTHIEIERFIFFVESEFPNPFISGLIHVFSVDSLRGKESMSIKSCYDIPGGTTKNLAVAFSSCDSIKAFYSKIGILDSNDTISRLIDKHYYRNLFPVGRVAETVCIEEILKQKALYLPNNKLTLHYDLTISFGVEHSQIEVVSSDNTFTFFPSKVPSRIDLPRKKYSCSCTDNYSSLKNDFQNLYQEGTVCDFTIKVGSENLQVHKAVLCARSPVFKAMLTNNMKENEKNMVVISDLEIDTVRRMLSFMYTDTTDDLDWEKAKTLYFAADKYVLLTLKRICSDIFKQNLSVANVGKILTLASMHADDDLKKTTLEFVCDHEIEVMCSAEWKTFMSEELQLAAEIMHQIFLKKAGNYR